MGKIQCLQQINVKNAHPVYSAGIRTHNQRNMSFLTKPLDQGSSPNKPLAGIVLYSKKLACVPYRLASFALLIFDRNLHLSSGSKPR